jgi:hypothetical protein
MQEMNWIQISDFLFQVVAGAGGGAVVVVAVMRWVGDKWIDQRFNIRLATFKADREKELTQLRQKHENDLAFLNHRLNSRISKIHEKEFEVLPEAWLKVNMSHGSIHRAAGGLKEVPNVQRCAEQQTLELLSKLELTEFEQQEIRSKTGDEKQRALNQVLELKDINQARENQRLLQNYLIQNQIFMTKELQQIFTEVKDQLQRALSLYESGMECGDGSMKLDAFKLAEDARDKLPALERAIQERLHYGEA